MPGTPPIDEELDRLLRSLDPLDRKILFVEGVRSARNELGDAIVGEARRRARTRVAVGGSLGVQRRPRPRSRRLALLGAVVGALAAGVLVVSGLLPSGGSHTAQLGPTPASAAIALDRAATTAMRQAAVYPTASQYEYLKVQEGITSSVGQASFGVRFWQSDTKQDWYRANGAGRERVVNSRDGLLAPLDRSIARAHGLSWRQLIISQDGDMKYRAGGIVFYSYFDPAHLPTQPAPLLRAIEHQLRVKEVPPTATAGATASEVATAGVFSVIANRLLFASNSPMLRAALYRVIAHLPGVQLLGWQTDRLGRRGIAVAISHAEIGDEATRMELLFDPTTSDPLQTQLVQTAPLYEPGTPPLPRGTALRYTVFVKRGIVNSIEDLPGGGHLPFVRSIPGAGAGG